ncbi:hypothetical protein GOODEAATRI_034500 [Goodea atripinnis]|uniref:Cytochrome c oxidase subunit I n=1 Tax=Goodea atripinnis TaxID=208336 RepID=A0ABV0Q472_9TELE
MIARSQFLLNRGTLTVKTSSGGWLLLHCFHSILHRNPHKMSEWDNHSNDYQVSGTKTEINREPGFSPKHKEIWGVTSGVTSGAIVSMYKMDNMLAPLTFLSLMPGIDSRVHLNHSGHPGMGFP